jgi:AcrR family transcriptional regulator
MPSADPRVTRSRDAILATALELLGEGGLGHVTIDEVSRRSGVAKTTIYRHWPTRADLVIDTCAQLSTSQSTPDTGSFLGDASALLSELATLLERERWATVLPSVVDAAERDPQLAVVHAGLRESQVAPYRTVIERAIARGELPAETDVSAVISALVGPLFYRRWFSRGPIDATFVHQLVATVASGRF